jgi:tetratricopeptide (TPR) repeat protein
MRRVLICALLILICPAACISAVDNNSVVFPLSELSRHNEIPQLIQTANALLANANLSPIEQGIVLTYLGHAYQQRGDFHSATAYYEKALKIIDRDGQHPFEYATTLSTLGALYAETGQIDAAKHILHQSVHLFEKAGGHHDEIAIIWNDLATIAADQHSSHEAHKCMAHAIAESQLSNKLTSDDLSSIAATQASIATLDGDRRSAISGYQRSLTLSKLSHEDEHPETAWLYVLLGEAYLQTGNIAEARENTSRGLNLLDASTSHQSSRFLGAELAYAKVLDASGARDEASTLRKEAEADLKRKAQRAQGEVSLSGLY